MPCECVKQSIYNVHKKTGSLFLRDSEKERDYEGLGGYRDSLVCSHCKHINITTCKT